MFSDNITITLDLEEKSQNKLVVELPCFYSRVVIKEVKRDKSNLTQDSDIEYNSGIYTMFIIDDYSEHKKLMKLITHCYWIIRDLCDRKGISDNETEAYMYGYLLGECFCEFINKKELFSGIPKKKHVEFVIKNTLVNCIIKSQITGKDEPGKPRYTISSNFDGCIQYRNKQYLYLLLRPYKYYWRRKNDIFFHEFYHLSRELYKQYNGEYERYILMQEILNNTLPILNKYYNNE